MKAMKIKKLFQAVVVLLIASAFTFLGVWQLQRASDLRESQRNTAIQDTTIYDLSTLAKPATALDSRSVGKIVQVQGHYIADFKAPHQVDSDGKVADWEVGLLQVGTTQTDQSSILVLRGLWSERLKHPEVSMANLVEVKGIIAPHQNDDLVENAPGVISRIDSSVIVSQTDTDLFDGFIVATNEKLIASGESLERQRVVPPKPVSKVAGFYWQHISYVIIWWLMAGISLFAPFYRRKIS